MNILAQLISVATFIAMWDSGSRMIADRRSAFLAAAALWTVWVVAITEGLSLFRSLAYWPVLAAWCIALVAALGTWLKVIGRDQPLWKGFATSRICQYEWMFVAGAAFIACITGVIAFVAPPNTYDAMTYHMPKIMHWIQNRTVAYYPTHILRQLYLSPGAEYIILQFQILGGSDRLANLVQWFSMAGSVLAVSLIARHLGAGLRGQVFSSVAAVTIPMGILQASSTQTDYVATFWLVCFVYFAFLLAEQARPWQAVACGASLGLGILTKATTYIYAPPFLAWLVVLVLRRYRARGMGLLALVATAALVINGPTYMRNYKLFYNPLGLTSDMEAMQAGDSAKFSNEVFTPAGTLSNVVRDLALNLATPSDAINSRLETAVAAIHQVIGISVDDARTTWPGMRFELMRSSFREITMAIWFMYSTSCLPLS